jgi:hypothetical protein
MADSLLTIIALLTLTLYASAQKKVSYGYTEIRKPQFDSCGKTSYLLTNSQIKKQAGKLIIAITGKSSMVQTRTFTNLNF